MNNVSLKKQSIVIMCLCATRCQELNSPRNLIYMLGFLFGTISLYYFKNEILGLLIGSVIIALSICLLKTPDDIFMIYIPFLLISAHKFIICNKKNKSKISNSAFYLLQLVIILNVLLFFRLLTTDNAFFYKPLYKDVFIVILISVSILVSSMIYKKKNSFGEMTYLYLIALVSAILLSVTCGLFSINVNLVWYPFICFFILIANNNCPAINTTIVGIEKLTKRHFSYSGD